MKTRTLVLALTLVVLAVAAPTTYVLAHRGTSSSYYGVTGSEFENEEWWNEMREHMEQRWDDIDNKDWWDEMNKYIEEHWEELENDDYRYGRSSSYGGCHG